MPSRAVTRLLKTVVVMLAAATTFIASAFTAWAATDITITFVRHGESYGNASCCINTQIPGPDLTPTGQTQADLIGQALADDGIDYSSIYYSNMIRTQQTAAPFAADTGLTETELAGLHEVQAGLLEGANQNSGLERIFYALIPLAWSLGLYSVPMLGSADATGSNFESRFNSAVAAMYADGGALPVAFSHGMAIMAWTLMNVKNPDPLLMLTDPLSNTDTVTVTGNPTDGWTLVSWGGKAVTQNPALFTKLLVNVRDLIATPQMALYNFTQALGTRNISTIANAVRTGVFNTLSAVVNFPINVIKSVVKSITTGTLFKAAAPPAGVSVPPTGSDLGDATGVPSTAATNAALSAAAVTAAGTKNATSTKPVHAKDAGSTVATEKSGSDDVTKPARDHKSGKADTSAADSSTASSSTPSSSTASAGSTQDTTKDDNVTKSDKKSGKKTPAKAGTASPSSASSNSGNSSGHRGGHK